MTAPPPEGPDLEAGPTQTDSVSGDQSNSVSGDPTTTVSAPIGATSLSSASEFFSRRPLPSGDEASRRSGSEAISQVEANRIQVQRHQQEMLSANFTRWVIIFSLALLIMLPVMVALFVWLIVSYMRENNTKCDVPLREWVVVVCSNIAYHTNLCGFGSVHTLVLKHIFKHDPRGATPSKWYVKAYNLLVTILIFVWHCVGLHWVRTSDTCEDKSPYLFSSVKVFAAFSVVFNIFVYINTVGLYTIMMFMLRNGLLHSDRAAPEGTLDQQAVVKFDQELFLEHKECCVCMVDFDADSEIRRTRCGHVYHGKCLGGWLKVNHTCPLCRADLTGDTE
eukprot:TRINITY_DN1866_c0_g2_i2.p1 TRINITY_DN1866_c0_g2~~TRINITY_DN1866_c0_g2_i2.p1  ORF type:complete len:335 (-),score=33.08 TRINITY_DN1866_c0_g2_i2:393-1397(-)